MHNSIRFVLQNILCLLCTLTTQTNCLMFRSLRPPRRWILRRSKHFYLLVTKITAKKVRNGTIFPKSFSRAIHAIVAVGHRDATPSSHDLLPSRLSICSSSFFSRNVHHLLCFKIVHTEGLSFTLGTDWCYIYHIASLHTLFIHYSCRSLNDPAYISYIFS